MNLSKTQTNTVFLNDVIEGLSENPKYLHCKYFYDERGSQLFDQICELEEYYLTRTEASIMEQNAREMAEQIDSTVMLVELGSGSSSKTRILLNALHDPVAYVPVDISEIHLLNTAADLRTAYPQIEIHPVVADFTEGFELPETERKHSHIAMYFPGSTIGNFPADQALQLIKLISTIIGPGGGLLLGVDLKKEKHLLEAAYNDPKGVTAEFNLNILHRINRELGGNFDLERFHHEATYNEQEGRVELYLVSSVKQTVSIGGHSFHFESDEKILTEYSHKYTIDGFAKLAQRAGLSLHKHWTDENNLFAVMHLVNDRDPTPQIDQ